MSEMVIVWVLVMGSASSNAGPSVFPLWFDTEQKCVEASAALYEPMLPSIEGICIPVEYEDGRKLY